MSWLSWHAWRWVSGAAVPGVVLLWTGPFVAGLRVWERLAGQAVLVVVTAAVLVRLAPGRWWAPAALGFLLSLLVMVLASTVAVAGHLATYLVAARAVGLPVAAMTLAPLALFVLLAAGLPTNVARRGPGEGVAAWVLCGRPRRGAGGGDGCGVRCHGARREPAGSRRARGRSRAACSGPAGRPRPTAARSGS